MAVGGYDGDSKVAVVVVVLVVKYLGVMLHILELNMVDEW